jgi:hypothetical protein
VDATTPVAFLSYAHRDDTRGGITAFREALELEIQVITGRHDICIFQDRDGIGWGDAWKERIERSLDAVTFLVPIVTPSFLASPHCREELRRFFDRERGLGRRDLVLPVYWIETQAFDHPERHAPDELLEELTERQYVDWRELRYRPPEEEAACRALTKLAKEVRDALNSTSHADPSIGIIRNSVVEVVDRSVVDVQREGLGAVDLVNILVDAIRDASWLLEENVLPLRWISQSRVDRPPGIVRKSSSPPLDVPPGVEPAKADGFRHRTLAVANRAVASMIEVKGDSGVVERLVDVVREIFLLADPRPDEDAEAPVAAIRDVARERVDVIRAEVERADREKREEAERARLHAVETRVRNALDAATTRLGDLHRTQPGAGTPGHGDAAVQTDDVQTDDVRADDVRVIVVDTFTALAKILETHPSPAEPGRSGDPARQQAVRLVAAAVAELHATARTWQAAAALDRAEPRGCSDRHPAAELRQRRLDTVVDLIRDLTGHPDDADDADDADANQPGPPGEHRMTGLRHAVRTCLGAPTTHPGDARPDPTPVAARPQADRILTQAENAIQTLTGPDAAQAGRVLIRVLPELGVPADPLDQLTTALDGALHDAGRPDPQAAAYDYARLRFTARLMDGPDGRVDPVERLVATLVSPLGADPGIDETVDLRSALGGLFDVDVPGPARPGRRRRDDPLAPGNLTAAAVHAVVDWRPDPDDADQQYRNDVAGHVRTLHADVRSTLTAAIGHLRGIPPAPLAHDLEHEGQRILADVRATLHDTLAAVADILDAPLHTTGPDGTAPPGDTNVHPLVGNAINALNTRRRITLLIQQAAAALDPAEPRRYSDRQPTADLQQRRLGTVVDLIRDVAGHTAGRHLDGEDLHSLYETLRAYAADGRTTEMVKMVTSRLGELDTPIYPLNQLRTTLHTALHDAGRPDPIDAVDDYFRAELAKRLRGHDAVDVDGAEERLVTALTAPLGLDARIPQSDSLRKALLAAFGIEAEDPAPQRPGRGRRGGRPPAPDDLAAAAAKYITTWRTDHDDADYAADVRARIDAVHAGVCRALDDATARLGGLNPDLGDEDSDIPADHVRAILAETVTTTVVDVLQLPLTPAESTLAGEPSRDDLDRLIDASVTELHVAARTRQASLALDQADPRFYSDRYPTPDIQQRHLDTVVDLIRDLTSDPDDDFTGQPGPAGEHRVTRLRDAVRDRLGAHASRPGPARPVPCLAATRPQAASLLDHTIQILTGPAAARAGAVLVQLLSDLGVPPGPLGTLTTALKRALHDARRPDPRAAAYDGLRNWFTGGLAGNDGHTDQVEHLVATLASPLGADPGIDETVDLRNALGGLFDVDVPGPARPDRRRHDDPLTPDNLISTTKNAVVAWRPDPDDADQQYRNDVAGHVRTLHADVRSTLTAAISHLHGIPPAPLTHDLEHSTDRETAAEAGRILDDALTAVARTLDAPLHTANTGGAAPHPLVADAVDALAARRRTTQAIRRAVADLDRSEPRRASDRHPPQVLRLRVVDVAVRLLRDAAPRTGHADADLARRLPALADERPDEVTAAVAARLTDLGAPAEPLGRLTAALDGALRDAGRPDPRAAAPDRLRRRFTDYLDDPAEPADPVVFTGRTPARNRRGERSTPDALAAATARDIVRWRPDLHADHPDAYLDAVTEAPVPSGASAAADLRNVRRYDRLVAGDRSPGDGDAAFPGGWRGALLVLRFLTEVALLAVLAAVGAGLAGGAAASVGFGLLLPAVAAVIWGVLMAPRSRRRLADPGRLCAELILFAGSAGALAAGGHAVPAAVFAGVAVSAAVLVRVFAPGA